MDGFLYSFLPTGDLKKFPKRAAMDLVIQDSPSLHCSGSAVYNLRSSGLSTVFGALDEIDDDEEHGQKQGSVTNEWEAKAVAYHIFNNVAKHGSK